MSTFPNDGPFEYLHQGVVHGMPSETSPNGRTHSVRYVELDWPIAQLGDLSCAINTTLGGFARLTVALVISNTSTVQDLIYENNGTYADFSKNNDAMSILKVSDGWSSHGEQSDIFATQFRPISTKKSAILYCGDKSRKLTVPRANDGEQECC